MTFQLSRVDPCEFNSMSSNDLSQKLCDNVVERYTSDDWYKKISKSWRYPGAVCIAPHKYQSVLKTKQLKTEDIWFHQELKDNFKKRRENILHTSDLYGGG